MLWFFVAAAIPNTPPQAAPAKPSNDPASWVLVADYPPEAIDKHQEGAVAFKLAIDAQGKVTTCAVTASSGAASLDAATCALVSARAQFVPARDNSGAAVSGKFSSRIRWVYPTIAEAPAPKAIELPNRAPSKMGAADIWVGADGIVTKCEQAPRPYANISAPPDLCPGYPVGSRFSGSTTLRGKPQKRKIRIVITTDETYVR